MNWDFDDIVQYLYDLYLRKFNRMKHFEKNDNDVDREYEMAQMDLIVDLISSFTQAGKQEIYERIDDLLEGVFLFDPQENPNFYLVKKGKSYQTLEDIYYSSLSDFVAIYEKDALDYLLKNIFVLNSENKEVYIPKGTIMTYKGITPGAGGWPTFEIKGEEFEFAGDAFKLKPVN